MAEHTDHTSAPLIGRLEALTAIAVVGFLALALALIGLALPTHKVTTGRLSYRQSGTFSYQAATPPGSVYGAGGLKSGEPIATTVINDVGVRFTYRLASNAAVDVHGTQSLIANVKLNSGLTRQFTLETRKTFNGPTFSAAGTLPVGRIARYITASSTALSGDVSTGATVSVISQISAAGTVGSRPVATTYSPSLPFAFSGTSLTLSQDAANSSVVQVGSAANAALTPSQSGSVAYRHSQSNTMRLLVARPSVALVREVGFAIAAWFLLCGLIIGRPLMRSGTEANERDRTRALYGSMLIPVRSLVTPDAAVAEVASMSALAELAKRYESMILHRHRDDGDDYMVWDNGMLYRHVVGAPEASRTVFTGHATRMDTNATTSGGVSSELSTQRGVDVPSAVMVKPSVRRGRRHHRRSSR